MNLNSEIDNVTPPVQEELATASGILKNGRVSIREYRGHVGRDTSALRYLELADKETNVNSASEDEALDETPLQIMQDARPDTHAGRVNAALEAHRTAVVRAPANASTLNAGQKVELALLKKHQFDRVSDEFVCLLSADAGMEKVSSALEAARKSAEGVDSDGK